LQLEEEEEPSYLKDLNNVPDFMDEAPVEEAGHSERILRLFQPFLIIYIQRSAGHPEAIKTAAYSGS
jgi:hypothetical protein